MPRSAHALPADPRLATPFDLPSASEHSPVVARAAQAVLPLPELDPATYARSHAAFEARSDQRALVARWLGARLAARRGRAVRVLSVGCGDGTLDAVLATGLAEGGGPVTYDGIEPYAGSADSWERAMSALPGVTSQVSRGTLAEHVDHLSGDRERYDVVLAVHSLYYVPDVAKALEDLLRLVADGGELIVLHAPLAALNALVTQLAPRSSGHPQWFSEVVAAAIAARGEPAVHHRLQARLDLHDLHVDLDARDAVGATEPTEPSSDHDVLDFAVQAVLPPALRDVVREHLRDLRLPGGVFEVPHPVDAFVLARTG